MRIAEIKGTGMELTDAIKQYAEKKLEPIAKITEKWEPCDVRIEVGKTTHHHAKGDVFRTEYNLTSEGGFFRAESTKDDLYASIDDAASDLRRQIVDFKDKMKDKAKVVVESVDIEHEIDL